MPGTRRVALVHRAGDLHDLPSPRLQPMVAALEAADLVVVPLGYRDGAAEVLASALAGMAGALVWADPLGEDGDRAELDRVLRDVADAGVWVSSHPDVIDRLGTKEVLVTTRQLGWGSDAHLYRSRAEFRRAFPARLGTDGVRVLKADRGNGGRTVWKVQRSGHVGPGALPLETPVRVQHARVRDATVTQMSLGELMSMCEQVFAGWAGTGRLVDQEFVPGITRGILRCYFVGAELVGFARQYPAGARAQGPLDVVPAEGQTAEQVLGLPSAKTMYAPDEPALAGLRHRLETEWVPGMTASLGLAAEQLPALWDIDLLLADPGRVGSTDPRYVLCEINASCIIPFPPSAPARLARHVGRALSSPPLPPPLLPPPLLP